jgi:hypothetical protein
MRWRAFSVVVLLIGTTVIVPASTPVAIATSSTPTFVRTVINGAGQGAVPYQLGATSIDVEGDLMVVGSGQAEPSEVVPDAGQVQIFRRDGVGWTLEQVLYAPNPSSNGRFGEVVSTDGTRVAVVSREGTYPSFGRLYVYQYAAGGWTLEFEHHNDPALGREFWSVDIRGDALAVSDRAGGTAGVGFVRMFRRSPLGWNLEQTLAWGGQVAISGNELVNARGGVLVYAYSAGSWNFSTQLGIFPGSENVASVDFSGDDIVLGVPSSAVGDGAIIPYRRSGTSWAALARLSVAPVNNDFFGRFVSFGDGTLISSATNEGTVHVFQSSPTGWAFQRTLNAEPNDGPGFGSPIASDGTTVVVGLNGYNGGWGALAAYNSSGTRTWFEGAGAGHSEQLGGNVGLTDLAVVASTVNYLADVYPVGGGPREARLDGSTPSNAAAADGRWIVAGKRVYEEVAGSWIERFTMGLPATGSVFDVEIEGSVMTGLGGFNNSSEFVIYELDGSGQWTLRYSSPLLGPGQVSIAPSGDWVVAQTRDNSGQVDIHIVRRTNSGWTKEFHSLPPLPSGTLSLVDDTTLVHGSAAGRRVSVLTRVGRTWTATATFDGPTGSAFGSALAASGDQVVVGSPNESVSGWPTQTGAWYLLSRDLGSWALQGPIVPAEAQLGDSVGSSVSIEGGSIVIGATGKDGEAGWNAGGYHQYTLGPIDSIPPLVSGTASGSLGLNGWFVSPVTVDWTAVDPEPSAGAATQPPATIVSTEGADQMLVSESSCDPAGNCATGSVTVSIDYTSPVLVPSASPAPNAAGWNNEPVEVSVTCLDAVSGIPDGACPEPVVVLAETTASGQAVSFTAADVAGNEGSSPTLSVSIDLTAPLVTLNSPADGAIVHDFNYEPPTCMASDALSGLNGECTVNVDGPVTGPGTLRYRATALATDNAGNSTTVSSSYTIIVDHDAPTVSYIQSPESNANGWSNGAATFTFDCTDASGVAHCPAPVTISTEGANQSFVVYAADSLDNVATVAVSGINIDVTKPTVDVSAPVSVNPVDTVTITCGADDTLSGIDLASCMDLSIPATDLEAGANTFTFWATDRAGNATVRTVTVTLVVTPTSIGALIAVYLGNTPGAAGIVNSLVTKLNNGNVDGFLAGLAAHCCAPAKNKRLTQAQVDLLDALAQQA